MATPIVTAPRHTGHAPAIEIQCGRILPAFDTVERMASVLGAVEALPDVELREPSTHPRVAITRVHDAAFVDYLERAWEQAADRPEDDLALVFADTFLHEGLAVPRDSVESGPRGPLGRYCFDTITGVGPQTWDAAAGSVDSALTAADAVLAGERLAVALCRPPGHHVTRSVFGGGCYLNNAAITAQWLRDGGVGRVAVLDVDFHHGNGTQALFYERSDVSYTSLHGHPSRSYPYYTGHADETGEGEGRGYNLNLPLGPATAGDAYVDTLERAAEAIAAQRADVLLVSLGFDTYHADGSGDAILRTEDYARIGARMGELGLPVLAVLEGGYSVEALGPNLVSWLSGVRAVAPSGQTQSPIAE